LRDQVLAYGAPFSLKVSSNSNRKPVLFDWTAHPSAATVDTTVCINGGIIDAWDKPGRKIGWLCESPAIMEWQKITATLHADLDKFMAGFEVVLTPNLAQCGLHSKFIYHPAGSNLPWIPEDQYAIYKKTRMCSMYASTKTMVDGQLYRQQVAAKLKDQLDLYGGACGSRRIGMGPPPDKSPGLIPYRFHVAMENCQVPLYYSEKLMDCFATGTVAVYWGADGIKEICDIAGVIVLDDSFDPGDLSEDLYQAMLPAVRHNFEMVKQLESADDMLYRLYVKPGRSVAVAATISATEPKAALDGWTPPRVFGSSALSGQPGRTCHLPWPSWNPEPIQNLPPVPSQIAASLIEQVRGRNRKNIRCLGEVPPSMLSTRKITTTLQRPRSLRLDTESMDWFPQLTDAFLLHLPGGFIGDNVVFDNERYYNFDRWWLGSGADLYAQTERMMHIDSAISIASWGGEAFQHFILDTLPTLAGVIDFLETREGEDFRIVSHFRGSPAIRYFWRKLGLTHRVIQKPINAAERFVIHADRVLYSGYMPTLGEYGLYPRNVLRPLQWRLGLLQPVPRDRVLYLRRDRNSKRSIEGEDQLLSRLQAELADSGLKLEVFQSSLDQDQDMECFKRARVILGPHGGAFANLIFAQPGTHVIEFLPIYELFQAGQDTRAMYWGLSQAAGLDYWTVQPRNFDFDSMNMKVDVDEVIEIIRHLLKT